MPNYRIRREKENLPESKNRSADRTKVFKRANVARHGISQRTQQKRKYEEVESQPPASHAGIQKNTKEAVQSKPHDMRNLKTDKPKVTKILNITSRNTDTGGPIVTFTGPREALKINADTMHILDVVLEKFEKVPVPKTTTEAQQVHQPVPNTLVILNAASREVENTATSDNLQEEKKSVALKTVKETGETAKSDNAVSADAEIPDAIRILNVAFIKPEEFQSSRNSELTQKTDDPFYGTQSEYHEDILKYMVDLDTKSRKPKPGYMNKQPEVTGSMRSKLVDWLVHVFQGTNDKVLHMTVQFIDTFLSRMSVVKSKLQLLACAAGMVACKTEEVYIQTAEYWVILGGETFTKSQLLKMERIILSVLKFELSRPTIICFIRHVCYVGHVNAQAVTLANYISELVLVEGAGYLCYPHSLLASAAIALARHTLGQSVIWPQELIALTHHTLQQLLPLFGLLRKTFINATINPNTYVYKKYMNKEHQEVAKLPLRVFNPEEIQ